MGFNYINRLQKEINPNHNKSPSIHEFFFKVQVLRHTKLVNNKSMDIYSNVFPNTRPRTDRQGHPGR